MFSSNPLDLKKVLDSVAEGKLQLPDFQRDWVWDVDGVRSLLASIAAGFPIGAILTMETGGATSFKARPLSGAPRIRSAADLLLLDGQQRMTSCFQSLMATEPVDTKTSKGKEIQRYFFMDVRAAVDGKRLEDTIIAVPADRISRANFGREIVRDLSTRELQVEAMMFPLNEIFSETDWMECLYDHGDKERRDLFKAFRGEVIRRVQAYEVPVIQLSKENSRAAICTVFEKVNTGGKTLNAFELLTAMFAADEYDLREDMRGTDEDDFIRLHARRPRGDEIKSGRLDRIKGTRRNGVFKDLTERDVLQVATLLQTYEARQAAVAKGVTEEKRLPAVSIKADALLELRQSFWENHADAIEEGFVKARHFFESLHITKGRDVPYLPTAKTIAAVFALWDHGEMHAAARQRLERWFWCVTLGETYGSSTDTRVARDVLELLPWLAGNDETPRAITEISIQADRFDKLTTRQSAGYKALHAALLNEGCEDFRTAKPAHAMEAHDDPIDIHHIFPQAWARKQKIEKSRYDTIVNKTPLLRNTNQIVGGNAPSIYLGRLESELSAFTEKDDVQGEMDEVMRSHLIEPTLLRIDDFDAFYAARKLALAKLVESKTGRPVALSDDLLPSEDDVDDNSEDETLASFPTEVAS